VLRSAWICGRGLQGRAGGVRPQYQSDQQVAQAGRDAQALEAEYDGNPGPEQEQEMDQCLF